MDENVEYTHESLKLLLSLEEWQKYIKFCERINEHLLNSGYKTFKANHFFAEEYFKGSSDEDLMNHYKIAEYLHVEVLRECLHWYLGGLFRDMSVTDIENLYLGEMKDSSGFFSLKKKDSEENKRFTDAVGEFAALEHSDILNEKLIAELKSQFEKFEKEDISFLDEFLIGEPSSEINREGAVVLKPVSLNS